MDLKELRKEIDTIDAELIALFTKRMHIAEEVAKDKIKTGKAVFDKDREQQVLKKVGEKGENPFFALANQELFEMIMAISRKRQYQLLTQAGIQPPYTFQLIDSIPKENCKVVYQGVKGAYSYAAMKQYFDEKIDAIAVETWKDAMELVANRDVTYAVLPIENSTAGSVYDIYDLLAKYELFIVGEQIIPCEHALLGMENATLMDIKRVVSHPQALAQCETFLQGYPEWELVSMDNTAKAAKKVAMVGDFTQAAIASKVAGECYGLSVLADQIFLDKENSTRFIIVSREHIYTKKANKISICFELPHASGSLYHVLSHFIYNNINMTKIESRPIIEKSWEYRFFVDIEGNLCDGAIINALRGIDAETQSLRIFGCYE